MNDEYKKLASETRTNNKLDENITSVLSKEQSQKHSDTVRETLYMSAMNINASPRRSKSRESSFEVGTLKSNLGNSCEEKEILPRIKVPIE
jgi:hypothetical protein